MDESKELLNVIGNLPEKYERNTTYKCYNKCFEAMENVIA